MVCTVEIPLNLWNILIMIGIAVYVSECFPPNAAGGRGFRKDLCTTE